MGFVCRVLFVHLAHRLRCMASRCKKERDSRQSLLRSLAHWASRDPVVGKCTREHVGLCDSCYQIVTGSRRLYSAVKLTPDQELNPREWESGLRGNFPVGKYRAGVGPTPPTSR